MIAIDFTRFVTKNRGMAHSRSHSRILQESPVSFLTVVGRWLLCLCLWNSPLPLLHAHEDVAADQSSSLAQHLNQCHWRTRAEQCQCWHLHLVLWGQIQGDHPDSETPPPQPRPIQDDAAPSSEIGLSRQLDEAARQMSVEFSDGFSVSWAGMVQPRYLAGYAGSDASRAVRAPSNATTVFRC